MQINRSIARKGVEHLPTGIDGMLSVTACLVPLPPSQVSALINCL